MDMFADSRNCAGWHGSFIYIYMEEPCATTKTTKTVCETLGNKTIFY